MGERKELKIPKKFTDKYGNIGMIWSYSRLGTYHNCTYEYYLSRIMKYKSEDNIYSKCGSVAHDILEDFYNNRISYEKMIDKFNDDFLIIEMSDFKFSSDDEKNLKMRQKYKNCINHFFKNHKIVNEKVLTEREIWIDIDGNIFIGYVDAIHKEGDYYIITDYKTSSITEYKGKKLHDKQKQLLLYALGLNQLGVPLDKIKIRWNFLKYTNVSYQLKNGKIKTSQAERHKWVDAIKTPLKKDILSVYGVEDFEADIKVSDYIKINSLHGLDKSIQDKYILDDCYVYGEVTEENIEELKHEMVKDINDIINKGKDECNWEREEINKGEEYYCSVLCGMRKICKYYKDYLKTLDDNYKEENDLMKQLEDL